MHKILLAGAKIYVDTFTITSHCRHIPSNDNMLQICFIEFNIISHLIGYIKMPWSHYRKTARSWEEITAEILPGLRPITYQSQGKHSRSRHWNLSYNIAEYQPCFNKVVGSVSKISRNYVLFSHQCINRCYLSTFGRIKSRAPLKLYITVAFQDTVVCPQ